MVMKIENYEGTADTFTFPNNPNTFEDPIAGNASLQEVQFFSTHIVVGGGGIKPKGVLLNGSFFGTNKNTNYLSLSKHFSENDKLKKLFWEDDKFYIGIGESIKKTHAGGRTNFIDYIAQFRAIIGILFGSTEKTSGTNAGNVQTFVTEITGTVTSGASAVTVSDNHGNQLTIPASALTTGQSIVINLVGMVDNGEGVNVSEYPVATINGTQTNSVGATGNGLGLLKLDAGENVSTITTTNLTSAVVKFRDGFSA